MLRAKDDGDRPLDVIQIDRRGRAASFMPDAARKESAEHDMHFRQLLGTLRRHGKFVLTITAVGTALAGAIGFLIPARYTATAEIVVDPQQADAIAGSGIRAADEMAMATDTQVSMLSARGHLRRVLDSFSQESDPRTAIFRPDPQSADKKRLDPAWALDELERRLKIMQVRRSRVITISFTATNPETAAAVANRIANVHIASTVDAKRLEILQEMTKLAARATELKAEMKQTADALQAIPGHPSGGADGAQLNTLKREELVKGESYARVLRRQRELREQLESITPEAHILSLAAAPDRPSSPSPILFILPALIASALCGGVLAVVWERLDSRLRSERDVTEALDIPCIALVPRMPKSNSKAACHSFLSEPFAPYTEAIRSAAASLRLAETEGPPVTLLISSSVPGEGKTTFALSLAVYAAHLGRRTLIVDFDFRRPSILRELHAQDEHPAPNLADFPASKLIRRIPNLKIDYLPIPCSSADPITLFSGAYLKALQRQLREHYDCILIDSPPVIGVTEARMLRSFADKIIFVVKWGSTRREVAQNALKLLCNPSEPAGGRAVDSAAVVTQVDLRRHAKYHYGDTVETYVKYKKYFRGPAAA